MAHLSLFLLGPFQATLDGEPVDGFESNKVRALLTYLAVEADRPHSREKLAGLLWPEWPDRAARRNLRYALSNLRHAIGDRARAGGHQATPPFLHVTRREIQFNSASDAWVDVTAFSRLLEATMPATDDLEEAVDLYRGEFLEGFYLDDSAAFEEWALLKRDQLSRQVLAALHNLATACEGRGEYERAIPYAWRQVELEPWQEKSHRQLMRLLALSDRRGAALAQYEACRRALAEELGVEPAPKTTRLYERIRDGEVVGAGPAEDPASAREAEDTRPRRPAELLPEPLAVPVLPPPAQRRTSRRTVGRRLALVAVSLLLLVVAGAVALAESGFGDTALTSLITRPAARSEAVKVVEVCGGVAPPQICVWDVQADRRTQVTTDLDFEVIEGLCWSPDGQRICFGAGSDFEHALYVIDADGSHLRQLTSGDANDGGPIWSPDGQWIAFNRNSDLWIIHPDGSAAQMLWAAPDQFVWHMGWSPDSQQIAFLNKVRATVPLPEGVWTIQRGGTALQMVHTFKRPPDYAVLAWSPNGQHVVCVCGYPEGEKALLIDADGKSEPQVLSEIPWSWFPHFWPQWGEDR